MKILIFYFENNNPFLYFLNADIYTPYINSYTPKYVKLNVLPLTNEKLIKKFTDYPFYPWAFIRIQLSKSSKYNYNTDTYSYITDSIL